MLNRTRESARRRANTLPVLSFFLFFLFLFFLINASTYSLMISSLEPRKRYYTALLHAAAAAAAAFRVARGGGGGKNWPVKKKREEGRERLLVVPAAISTPLMARRSFLRGREEKGEARGGGARPL